jgi:hypothetical protein
MSSDPQSAAERSVHLSELGSLCRAVLQLRRADLGNRESCLAALRSALLVECVECGIRLSEPEMLDVAESGQTVRGNSRTRRLQKGYCARTGCHSYFYRVQILSEAGIAWNALDAVREAGPSPSAHELDRGENDSEPQETSRRPYFRVAARIALAVALLLVLFAVRQWYTGGTIPLLREPRTFEVVPDSVGEPGDDNR